MATLSVPGGPAADLGGAPPPVMAVEDDAEELAGADGEEGGGAGADGEAAAAAELPAGTEEGEVPEDEDEDDGLIKLPALLKAEDIPAVRPDQRVDDFPESYWSNSQKEDMVLGFVGNFTRQFRLLYNNRKPLFVTPTNECGMKKFVCTTVRPSLLPYRHLYNHEGSSEFVADYITHELLEPPTEPPIKLHSPTSTLWTQRGNCFDLSMLLCSLLEGAGYDAYCVHGYATREVCFADRSRREVEDEDNIPAPKPAPPAASTNKYTLKPASNMHSTYIQKMEERKAADKAIEDASVQADAEKARKQRLRPPHDPLGGLRVHCWVVVLRGKRAVPETFFIEPTLGEAVSAKSADYLGVESVWNSNNYWVNMQDCTEGCGKMHFDLGNSAAWEYVFPQVEQAIVSPGGAGHDEPEGGDVLDLPQSWVNELSIEPQDFETRCPHGTRTLLELETKTEIFSEYLKNDGMVKRVTRYADAEMTIPTKVVVTFAHRKDNLIRRTSNFTELGVEQIDEMFLPGRASQLKHHTYFKKHRMEHAAGGRKLFFYNDARVDGLERREDSGGQLRETFVNREDFLVKRVVDFSGHEGEGEGPGGGRRRSHGMPKSVIVVDDEGPAERVIVNMIETYLRNPAKPAHQDFKEIEFLDDAIYVTYHRDDRHVTAQTRELEKPQLTEKQQFPPIQPEEVHTFKVDPKHSHLRNFENQQLLDDLLVKEALCRKAVTGSLAETDTILSRLHTDNTAPKLELSFYDTTRNAESKARRERLEEEAQLERARREMMEKDYLAPFIVQQIEPDLMTDDMQERVEHLLARGRFTSDWKEASGWSETLMGLYNCEIEAFLRDSAFNQDDKEGLRLARKRAKAKLIKKQCLDDLRDRELRQAKLIQDWYEREQDSLMKRKEWYEKNQNSLKLDEKEEYANFCDDVLFRLKILDQRLARHKDESGRHFISLEHKLRNDVRLAEFLV